MNTQNVVPASGDIKLIAIDLDGTLLDSRDRVSEVNRRAVRQAVDAGVTPVIASGRIREESQFVLDSLPEIRYFIGMNGGLVEDLHAGTILREHRFDAETLRRIAERFDAAGIFHQIYAQGGVYCLGHWLDRLDESGMSSHYLEMFADTIGEWLPGDERTRPAYKLLAVAPTDDKAVALRAALSDCAGVEALCSLPALGYFEIIPAGIDKSYALAFLCDYLQVDRRSVLAIGDSENDEKMLRYAGSAAIVGNAAPMLRDIAGYVAPTNNDDGVADAISHYLFTQS